MSARTVAGRKVSVPDALFSSSSDLEDTGSENEDTSSEDKPIGAHRIRLQDLPHCTCREPEHDDMIACEDYGWRVKLESATRAENLEGQRSRLLCLKKRTPGEAASAKSYLKRLEKADEIDKKKQMNEQATNTDKSRNDTPLAGELARECNGMPTTIVDRADIVQAKRKRLNAAAPMKLTIRKKGIAQKIKKRKPSAVETPNGTPILDDLVEQISGPPATSVEFSNLIKTMRWEAELFANARRPLKKRGIAQRIK